VRLRREAPDRSPDQRRRERVRGHDLARRVDHQHRNIGEAIEQAVQARRDVTVDRARTGLGLAGEPEQV
jgi:hypothetical protein